MGILSVFLDQLIEFFEDLLLIFPNDEDLKYCCPFIKTYRKVNPKHIFDTWDYYILQKYRKQIETEDLDFFTQKDYRNDLVDAEWDTMANILKIVDKFKFYMKNLDEYNIKKTMKYLNNLVKLSDLYKNKS
tara:strand:+ start:671 stop:1063 length:393 start_codon:yes stop_codon:yes gene_type:complete